MNEEFDEAHYQRIIAEIKKKREEAKRARNPEIYLAELLSEELAKEIDKDILRNLMMMYPKEDCFEINDETHFLTLISTIKKKREQRLLLDKYGILKNGYGSAYDIEMNPDTLY